MRERFNELRTTRVESGPDASLNIDRRDATKEAEYMHKVSLSQVPVEENPL